MSRSSASGHTDQEGQGVPGALAGTVQPHGVLLVVQEPLLRIVQVSTSAAAMLGRPLDSLLLATLHDLGGTLAPRLQALLASKPLARDEAMRCTLGGGTAAPSFECRLHRTDAGALVLELEPLAPAGCAVVAHASNAALLAELGAAVQHFGEAASVAGLAAAAARAVQALLGYDRVVVSELGSDGRSHVLAETPEAPGTFPLGADARVEVLSPQSRQQWLRQRLRVLVDVDAQPALLLPELPPGQGGACDLADSHLRCVSPHQAQRLRAQGVAASVVAALVCDGRLWGLITCHHGRPRRLRQATRAAIELLAEAFATRVLALENYALAQRLAEVRRLAQRLLDATAIDGDWHAALLRHPRALLQPLSASGALLCHEGQTLVCGQVPGGPARQALLRWLQAQPPDPQPVYCTTQELALAAATDAAELDGVSGVSISGMGSIGGVMAVRLSQTQADCLLWVRSLEPGTGTTAPWTRSDIALASAFGAALADLMLQVNAVRLLIAESHLAQMRAAVAGAPEAVVVTDATQRACYANPAFQRLVGQPDRALHGLDALADLFTEPRLARRVIGQVRAEQRPWRGEMTLQRTDGRQLPVAVRAEPVPASDRSLLGTIFIFEDISAARHAEAARARAEAMLARTGRERRSTAGEGLLAALLANASLAAMDIAESGATAGVPPLLEEVQAGAARATALLDRIHGLDCSAED